MTDFKNQREIKQYELMVQVAKLYYVDNLSQQQIADEVGMSRSNVSRILNNCKEEGIVEIRIHEAALRTLELKQKLLGRFDLKDIVIVPRNADDEHILDSVCRAASDYVQGKRQTGCACRCSDDSNKRRCHLDLLSRHCRR